jgi:hypothetical protein
VGLALLSDHFYQPLPSRKALLEHRVSPRAVEASLDGSAARVADLLARVRSELEPMFTATGVDRPGSQIARADAALLYAILRDRRPARVTEVGSGTSTRVIAAALGRNAALGARCELLSIDPFSIPDLGGLAEGVHHVHVARRLQEADPAAWERLGPGDVLFVDSSHVYKAGSDVELEFTTVYPALDAGVLLHVHDVFFPRGYPAEWDLKESRFWNEQDVWAAVLASSDRYRVLACLSALAEARPQALAAVAPGGRRTHDGASSLWLTVAGDG